MDLRFDAIYKTKKASGRGCASAGIEAIEEPKGQSDYILWIPLPKRGGICRVLEVSLC
jgi:hypothetical protein